MIHNTIIQKFIDDLKIITKIEICVLNLNNQICAKTFDIEEVSVNEILNDKTKYIVFIIDNEYTIVIKGENKTCITVGKICVSQIENLIMAYKQNFDKNTFIQDIIINNISRADMYDKAKKYNIENNANRIAIIIKTNGNNRECNTSIEMLKNMFEENERYFITIIEDKSIVLIKKLEDNCSYKEVFKICTILYDMFSSEIMIKVKISYGTIINNLKDIAISYNEAKISMEIGEIFYSEKKIIGYDNLGLGRLMYRLPINICENFINETFERGISELFNDETLITINKFFENNLNISETSRRLYIHRNTLVYRLDKIQKVTGLDIKIFEDALVFKISLMVSELVRR